ncbi:excalibur calcium-binding domain-containing protein [Streptomonospora litoralis]|uniref:Excalibur calcium-binding domain protein n=1 Tax=Streptomonospora litoralis TaxID=2498135 RepID=A0A4P6Q4P2_9ACTN|nr:excalibur calcium-binding domain-containing protein [Streptomonospora litoralis]QBI55563.1 Excalibur calcium-binding domain protein [Streptomonospora litoralis]
MTDSNNRTAIAVTAGCGALVFFVLVVGACSAAISAAGDAPDGPRPTVTATVTAVATTTETATPRVTATETVTETAEPPADDNDDNGGGGGGGGGAPAAPPAPPAPEPEPEPAPDVYYENCTDARAKGGAPVYRGEPGYGPHLDRDGDGVGCE